MGADAIKFQSYKAEKPPRFSASYWSLSQNNNQSIDLLKSMMPLEKYEILYNHCEKEGIILSTPFDIESADFL